MKTLSLRPRLPSLLAYALEYASRGIRVYPVFEVVDGHCACGRGANCESPGKHPRIKDWLNQASVDPDQIKEWWQKWLTANIGIRTDERIVVLDVDPRNSGDKSLADLQNIHGPLPTTPTARTGGGGYHYYFTSALPLQSRSGALGLGLDLKARNGSAIAPPSCHAGGGKYQWLENKSVLDIEPSLVPEWMLNMLQQNDRPVTQLWHASPTQLIPEGTRNETLFKMACSMRRGGLDDDAIHVALNATNERRCTPPLSGPEIQSIVQSTHRYPSGSAAKLALNDSGNATRFARKYSKNLKWVRETKSWIKCTDTHWEPIDGEVVVRMAASLVHLIDSEADAVDDRGTRAELKKFAQQSGNAPRLKAIEQLARGRMSTSSEQFDACPDLLNVRNGTIDLTTGKLDEHRPQHYLTYVLPVHLDPSAKCPKWLKWLRVITNGDDKLIRYLQRLAGYCLTGSINEQTAFVLYGSGANGKTTFLEVLRSILGPLARQTPRDTLLATNTDQIRADLARLKGARLVTATELEHGASLSEVILKQLTGGDPITARELYRPFVEYYPTFKLLIACNSLPRIRGTDEGIWRRIQVVPFGVTISESEQDPQLIEKLRRELPGILNWAIEGCLEWRKSGLRPPQSVIEASNLYRAKVDSIESFIRARCTRHPEARESNRALYAEYERWCQTAQQAPVQITEFGKALQNKGFGSARTKNKRYRLGLRLKAAG